MTAPEPVMLDGDRHESALCEKRGLFQEVCGCGWRSSWTTDEAAGKEHETHVAAEKIWGRLSEAQRAALDCLMASGFGQSISWGRRTDPARNLVNQASAKSLVMMGMVSLGGTLGVNLRDRGRDVHPLTRCSARHGGVPCGYCHVCRRRLPTPDLGACPHCGATDWDDD